MHWYTIIFDALNSKSKTVSTLKTKSHVELNDNPAMLTGQLVSPATWQSFPSSPQDLVIWGFDGISSGSQGRTHRLIWFAFQEDGKDSPEVINHSCFYLNLT